MIDSNPEFQLLQSIYKVTDEGNSPALVSQRQLANSAGLSVGLTNALLKRFIERGWVKLLHIDGRKIKYALTPSGMEEIALRALEYFARAERNTELYRKKIDIFIEGIVHEGYEALLLVGLSELDFLFDYACLRYKIGFYKNIKVFMREKDEQDSSWDGLVVVCADDFEDSEEMKREEEADIKQYLGIPKDVPLIKFSQLLMNALVKKSRF
jgi:DNA-binding MarR family transcriptional regulator